MAVRMSKERSQTGSSINELLARLNSPARSKAWKQFLDSYASTIMHVASQYEYDRGRLNDCYLYICEKLSDSGFRRLLSYQPESSASFRSWLRVVIANLCIDWRRHDHGRSRPFKSISKLSRLDQLVFKYRFEQGMSLQACLNTLQGQIPDLTEPQLAGAVSRLNETLTPSQQWLIAARRTDTVSLDHAETDGTDLEPVNPGPGPETLAEKSEEHDRLSRALARLTPRQRLLIKLRYQQDLTLKEVARLTRLGDPFRARRHIQVALDELAKHLKS